MRCYVHLKFELTISLPSLTSFKREKNNAAPKTYCGIPQIDKTLAKMTLTSVIIYLCSTYCSIQNILNILHVADEWRPEFSRSPIYGKKITENNLMSCETIKILLVKIWVFFWSNILNWVLNNHYGVEILSKVRFASIFRSLIFLKNQEIHSIWRVFCFLNSREIFLCFVTDWLQRDNFFQVKQYIRSKSAKITFCEEQNRYTKNSNRNCFSVS